MSKKVLLVLLLVLSGMAGAATATWGGSIDNLWTTSDNWDIAPAAGDTVKIVGGAAVANDPLVNMNVADVYADIQLGPVAGDTGLAYLTVVSGGALNCASFLTGKYVDNQGRLDISGGTITGTGMMIIAQEGTGVVNMTGGTLDFASNLILGDVQDYGTSEFNMSGGSAYFANWVGVGDEGGGLSTMNLSGDAYLQAKNLSVGLRDGTGILNISDDAHIYLNASGSRLRLGEADGGGTGTINMTGGTIDAGSTASNNIVLGYSASDTGIMTLSAGTVDTGAFVVGLHGDGDFTMTGGTLDLVTHLIVGESEGQGIWNMSGGLVEARNNICVGFGTSAGTTDLLNMTDGIIQAGDLVVGYKGAGQIDLSGGVINLTGNDTYIGQFENGTVNLSGGTFNAKNSASAE